MDQQDSVGQTPDGSDDLYDIATWEERASVDGLAIALYQLLIASTRVVVILIALLILVGIGGLLAFIDPQIGTLTLLSAPPAFVLTGYVHCSNVAQNEPFLVLVMAFLLGVLTATFAAILDSLLSNVGQAIAGEFQLVLGLFGSVVFYSLVVGPVEETVELLAVRLYAYSHDSFNAVIDGTVYSAVVGLGFATIEDVLYIARNLSPSGLGVGSGGVGITAVGRMVTAVRALVGPGHVIYSAITGYYPGLVKSNKRNADPTAIKDLTLAALVYTTYNSMVSLGSTAIAGIIGLDGLVAFPVYVIIHDGVSGLYPIGELCRYSQAYHNAHASGPSATSFSSKRIGFED